MNTEIQTVSFGLILHSGNAKSIAMEAITHAKKGEIKVAREKINHAKDELKKAQKVHADLIFEEANGTSPDFSLLLMHSEDHFAMGQIIVELATEMVDLHEKIESRCGE
ncbi:PTS lactose/cellobiose transporter subunit IIA [Lysinibacillus piscis]|uniref:PTS mannose transporter subunit IIA n=1 Tax=Lysinibacillus piscis TaxID=2518931 RepID=A0ABQ5NLU2_9BACI|nr:PTS lactose/cellobiose transporter subunit IIA [Lysinibacillus sp. KH24]GLC89077.1 PTS mannose transporter subunit IIA [Lysinibacillus sp. KH24]